MKNLLQQIQQSAAPLGTLLVIGAGNGKELAYWRRLGASSMILVEAHPRQAEELARRLHPEANETLIHQAVVAASKGSAILYPLNNPSYSSLNPPSALLDYYPNLRSDAPFSVPTTSLAALIKAQAPESESNDLLVIDAPGQAMQLLQGTPSEALHRFSWLLIACSDEPLYEGDGPASALSAWLSDMGFDNQAKDPDAIYPQSTLLFRRNMDSMQRYQLRQQIAGLQQKYDAQGQELEQQQATHQQQLARLNQEKVELTKARDEQTQLAGERQQQIDALTREKTELATARDTLAREKAELAKARDEQAKQVNECTARIKTLEAEAAENLHRQQLLQEELIKAEAQLELIKDLLLREPGL